MQTTYVKTSKKQEHKMEYMKYVGQLLSDRVTTDECTGKLNASSLSELAEACVHAV